MTWHNNLSIKQEYYSLHSLSPVTQNKLSSFKVLGLRQIDETFGLANIGWEVHEDHGWPRKSFGDIGLSFLKSFFYLNDFLLQLAMLPSAHWLHFLAMSETQWRPRGPPLPNLENKESLRKSVGRSVSLWQVSLLVSNK